MEGTQFAVRDFRRTCRFLVNEVLKTERTCQAIARSGGYRDRRGTLGSMLRELQTISAIRAGALSIFRTGL